MAKKSIGQFIAALRKANGLTQQEVADRLNVSNKAVSRWERDECAPDLSLIPALAEMFGVTCDELLKGERIISTPQFEKSEPKVEKQLKALINRAISGFKTLIWISLALSAVGFICMFGISYGFYRPVIGFAVMMLFEAIAFVIAAIAVTKMKEIKTDNELFENADASLIMRFNNSLGIFSFIAFFAVFSAILLSLPLVLFTSSNIQSVLTIQSYFLVFFFGIVLILTLIFIKAKKPYMAWIAEQPHTIARKEINRNIRLLNLLQLSMVVLAGILFIVASYCNTNPYQESPFHVGLIMTGLALLTGNIACFFMFIFKYKDNRKELFLPGIRNMLMIPCGVLFSNAHNVGFYSLGNSSYYEKYVLWNTKYIFLSIGLTVFIAVLFEGIKVLIHRKHR